MEGDVKAFKPNSFLGRALHLWLETILFLKFDASWRLAGYWKSYWSTGYLWEHKSEKFTRKPHDKLNQSLFIERTSSLETLSRSQQAVHQLRCRGGNKRVLIHPLQTITTRARPGWSEHEIWHAINVTRMFVRNISSAVYHNWMILRVRRQGEL